MSNLQESEQEVLESIGKDVLESWSNENIKPLYPDNGNDSVHQLIAMLSTPKNDLPDNWQEKFRKIVDSLSPIDFAIYGKNISYFLLSNTRTKNNGDYQIRHKSHKKHSDYYQMKALAAKRYKKLDIPPRNFPEWLPTI
ncbi:hypothetical protein TVAG_147190 [Trichomonas vaginalis G3]|uniref:Uncharacterized protein n=1 Tax=Trichomonas vaginalis (strain ATCC PRA-98 / G3) TaxID=412133 RepID=A2DL21_TRIV3|nr:hypothetical protein TVAGG3_0362530 [Trichomonas vaginalis G3]EAY18974.1 hypothetical protein TVAG_147190 [Trichomonas vaginalis G3]KAI5532041.1 hypothetical protein TVAGG3_0362530 [Trichomonas vaginalis G3]|eukprot:XP_001579960.1 hypothetical protein [Trichomonas vaginalis G3]